MPDRYGDHDPIAALPPAEQAQLRAQAIANCGLCDQDGYRRLTVCDHTDHTPAAKRGMAQIRAAMGWNPPPPHPHPENRPQAHTAPARATPTPPPHPQTPNNNHHKHPHKTNSQP